MNDIEKRNQRVLANALAIKLGILDNADTPDQVCAAAAKMIQEVHIFRQLEIELPRVIQKLQDTDYRTANLQSALDRLKNLRMSL